MSVAIQLEPPKRRLGWRAKLAIVGVLLFLIATAWVVYDPITDVAVWNNSITLHRTGGGSFGLRYESRNLQGTAWNPGLREGWISLGLRNGPAVEVQWSSLR